MCDDNFSSRNFFSNCPLVPPLFQKMLPDIYIGSVDAQRLQPLIHLLEYPRRPHVVSCDVNEQSGALGCVECHTRIARVALAHNKTEYISLEDNARPTYRYDTRVIIDAAAWLKRERGPAFIMLSLLPEPLGLSKGLRLHVTPHVRRKMGGVYANELSQAMLCNRAFAEFVLDKCATPSRCSPYDEWLTAMGRMRYVAYPVPFQRATASQVKSLATPAFNSALGVLARDFAEDALVYMCIELTIEYNLLLVFVCLACVAACMKTCRKTCRKTCMKPCRKTCMTTKSPRVYRLLNQVDPFTLALMPSQT